MGSIVIIGHYIILRPFCVDVDGNKLRQNQELSNQTTLHKPARDLLQSIAAGAGLTDSTSRWYHCGRLEICQKSPEIDGVLVGVARPAGRVGPNGDRGLSMRSGMVDCGG